VFNENNELVPDTLASGDVYASPTVFQLKAMLWHAGFLTQRGAETHRLDPTSDAWQLRQPLDGP
jgi:hypothetical protein